MNMLWVGRLFHDREVNTSFSDYFKPVSIQNRGGECGNGGEAVAGFDNTLNMV